MSKSWTGRLAPYRSHRNDEHLIALVDEAARYCGLHLNHDLIESEYWSDQPLERCVAVLLFLVDRGMIERNMRHGRRVFEPVAHAESWASAQSNLRPHLQWTLELLAALRRELRRRARSHNS